MTGPVVYDFSLFSEDDLKLFKDGCHYKLYEKFGCHITKYKNQEGLYFSVWAPNAENVCVVSDFNSWDTKSHPLQIFWKNSGIWEGFIPDLKPGILYKYAIKPKNSSSLLIKADPYAFWCETPPKSASVSWDLNYTWSDKDWLKTQKQKNALYAPISIYEVHLGSWKDGVRNYRLLAHELVDYVKKMGFTHIELLPIMDHPFYGSWGYQVLGYFAPTSMYGTPQDFMYFIDYLHQNGVGIILDWVVAHFPDDDFGLAKFDGTHLYEYADPKKGYHPDWQSLIFDYEKKEVSNFLINSMLFWLDKYHVDGIRVDAVASMLYLDYSRKPGEWIPNIYGSNENLEALAFLRHLNTISHKLFPNTVTIAEESTAWPMITGPVSVGGLGFDYKWNMGWMHDTLEYFSNDPIYRKYHTKEITFSMYYAYHENFILALSHDEVVYGKGSLYNKMPLDTLGKFANLRLLFGYQYTYPGKKLLFMGDEFGQASEWNHDSYLEWDSANAPLRIALQKWLTDLHTIYKQKKALFELDYKQSGFEWIDFNDYENTIISYLRKDSEGNVLIIIFNMTPIPRQNYRIGVPFKGKAFELLNSDNKIYGGNGTTNDTPLIVSQTPYHNRPYSLELNLPPLTCIILELK